MTPHATLDEGGFRRLIAGEAVELDGIGELILADMGYVRMAELVAEAVGASSLTYRAHSDQLITMYRTANDAWYAECVDHGWATGGPLRFVGETLGVHVQEEHATERVEDFANIFVAALYGLCGLSWDPAGHGIPEPARENRP